MLDAWKIAAGKTTQLARGVRLARFLIYSASFSELAVTGFSPRGAVSAKKKKKSGETQPRPALPLDTRRRRRDCSRRKPLELIKS